MVFEVVLDRVTIASAPAAPAAPAAPVAPAGPVAPGLINCQIGVVGIPELTSK